MSKHPTKLFLAGVAATLVLMAAAASAPALAQGMADDTDCVLAGLLGEEFGLCNAYCEAMDCDADTPQASAKACEKVRAKFEAIEGVPELPCLAVQSENAPPELDLSASDPPAPFDTTATFVSFGDAVPIAVDVEITDDDGDTITSATVTLTNPLDGVDETLSLTLDGDSLVMGDLEGGAWNFDSATGVLTITGEGTLAQYSEILQQVAYDNALGNPTIDPNRSITVLVSDGTENSNAATSLMAVEVGCPCPSFSSDMIINTALRAYRPINSARSGDCDSGGTNCYDSPVHDSCTRFGQDSPSFFEYDVFIGDENAFEFSSFFVRAGFGTCRMSIFAERGRVNGLNIFAEKRAEDCLLDNSCNSGTTVAPFEWIVDFTQEMDDACIAKIPRLRAILVDFWENPDGIARLPRCTF